jgi:hypothetical protein
MTPAWLSEVAEERPLIRLVDDEQWLDRALAQTPCAWPAGSRPRLSVWCSRPGSLVGNWKGCRSWRAGPAGYVRAPPVPPGGTPGIAPLVRSAYPHRRGSDFSPRLASLERLEQPAVPVGRRGECALIGAFLDRADADGAALPLRGEPGAGKTVLLDAVPGPASAAKVWVLRAGRVELEVDLTFSGLNQLLFPVYGEELHELSAMHRDALTVAVGVRNGPAPHRLLVSTLPSPFFPRLQRRHPRGPGRKDLSRDTRHAKRGRRRVRPPANAVTHDLRRLGLWPAEPAAINETISNREVHNERARTGHR